MALGSVNVPGALGRELKEADRALEARIASAEKTLSGMEKIPGSGPPTSQVGAQVGQIYINVVTGEQWKCIAVNDSGSVWEKLAGTGTALSAADVGAVDTKEKGKPGGVATLDEAGKVPTTQLPASMPASDVAAWAKQPNKPTYTAAEVGAATASHTHTPASIGAATASHSHTAAAVGAKASTWAPFYVGTSAPSDKTQLWIDTTASTGGLKYWNGSAWATVPVGYV